MTQPDIPKVPLLIPWASLKPIKLTIKISCIVLFCQMPIVFMPTENPDPSILQKGANPTMYNFILKVSVIVNCGVSLSKKC